MVDMTDQQIGMARCHLTDLPMEIFEIILDLLPPEDVACLSLCNKGLFELLASPSERGAFKDDIKQVSEGNPGVNNERMRFLMTLSRDLPRYIPRFDTGQLRL